VPAERSEAVSEPLRVWIDQELCTGDGLCVQYAPEVFEFDVDGLAYVKEGDGDLLAAPGALADVPANLRLDVIASAKECPGDCIHVVRAADGVEVAGPEANPASGAA
jgi:ferredoxin